MSPLLMRYLTQSYQRDVLHKAVEITPLTASSDLIDEMKAELARIDAMKLGANLAQRAFVDYQNRRAILELLGVLQVTAKMSPGEAADKVNFKG